MVTINGMLLDPVAQRRLERIREHNETKGPDVDYRNEPRAILERTKREVRAVLEDPRFPNEQARNQEAMRVAREGQRRHMQAVAEAERTYHAEVERLERMANPPRQRDVQTMNMRQLLRAELEPTWRRSPGAILQGYRDAIRRGDELEASVVEDYAGEYAKDESHRQEFAALTYEAQKSRLPAGARSALEQMEGLVADEYRILGANAQQKALMQSVVNNVRDGGRVLAEERREMSRNEMTVGGGQDE